MVAETVKSYPVSYPALIPLSPSVGGIPGYSSCSASSLLQNTYSPSAFSPAHRMDQRNNSPPPRSIHERIRSLSPTDMSIDVQGNSSLRSKADILTARKQREFIPDNKKDDSYWDRRRRNNEAAKRSREKRRFNDMILENRVLELSKENHLLKAQLTVISERYGIQGEGLINVDQVLSSMPQAEQILALSKRNKLSPSYVSVADSPPSSSTMHISNDISSSCNQYNSSQMSPSPPPEFNSYSRDGRQSPDFYHHRNNSMDRDEDPEEMQDLPTRQEHLHQVPQYASHRYQDADAENQHTYYEQKALNLCRTQGNRQSMSSPSPSFSSSSQSDYSSGADIDMTRHSPTVDTNQVSCLPHKLRHKTHLGDKDAARSLLALHGIKPEPRDPAFNEVEDSTSSDERDSAIGMSSSSSPINITENVSPPSGSRVPIQESLEYENSHLRNQIQHLASEVASIKYMMLANPRQNISSETDSDGSR